MASWKLTLEYDGTKYRGWQEQTNARTLAGELRSAAQRVLGSAVEIQAAGRTDAGVHALRQVVHLKPVPPRTGLEAGRLERELNEALPADMAVLRVEPAPRGFHARHDAVSRRYLYQIAVRKTAFGKKYVWWIKTGLDVNAMRAAAAGLAGRHDFVRFRALDAGRGEQSTIVQVTRAGFEEVGGLLLFRIEASHFLWKMVRRLVGTLVRVGQGEVSVAEFEAQVEGRGRELPIAEWTAPAAGLFLEWVGYAGESGDLLQSRIHAAGTDTGRPAALPLP